jgi:allantoin racemase
MDIQIELITPITSKHVRSNDDIRALERPGLSIHHSLLDRGPASIECEFDEALSVPDTIRKAIDAERRGANAIIIDCMGDPGLHACREVVRIPVLGPCQTAMHTAAMLGHSIAFITVLERLRSFIAIRVASYGLQQSYRTFRAVDVPVLEIHADIGRLHSALAREAMAAVKEDKADVIVLGCTGFFGCAEAMTDTLLANGIDVPVIDPIPLTVHVAEGLVRTRLSHSKRTYPPPSRKIIQGYEFPELAANPAR